MIRGTTPVVILHLPEEMTFDVLYITFAQDDEVKFEKTMEDVLIDGETIWVKLTQADTLTLDKSATLKVQLRGRVGDIAYASKIIRVSVSDILKDGEI